MEKRILTTVLLLPLFTAIWAYSISGKVLTSSSPQTLTIKAFYRDANDKLHWITDTATIIDDTFSIVGEVFPYEFIKAQLYMAKELVGQFLLNRTHNNLNIIMGNSGNIYIKPLSNIEENKLFQQVDSIYNLYLDCYGSNVQDLNSGEIIGKQIADENIQQQIYQYKIQQLQKNPANYYSLMMLYDFAHSTLVNKNDSVLFYFNKLSPTLQNTLLGTLLYKTTLDRQKRSVQSSEGRKIPYFEVRDVHNNLFRSSALQNKVSIIIFSAVWCRPCQKIIPSLKEIYNKYKKTGLKIVYFNLDDNIKAWKSHIQKHKFTWINVSELYPARRFGKKGIAKDFYVNSIPTIFLINKEGVIVRRFNNCINEMEILETEVKKQLK